jgi:hypothetical protein
MEQAVKELAAAVYLFEAPTHGQMKYKDTKPFMSAFL